MRIFGFELKGLQSLTAQCPNCDGTVTMVFMPSEKGTPIKIPTSLESILKTFMKGSLPNYNGPLLMLPKYDDLHVRCIFCKTEIKHCEMNNEPCLIGREEERDLE